MNSRRVVTQNAHLTLHYRLAVAARSGERDLVTSFGQSPATLQLGSGQLSPAIEAHLIGMSEGEHATLRLASDEAFGQRNERLVQRIARSAYDEKIDPTGAHAPGDVVGIPAPQGGRFQGLLKELTQEYALFDFNHPLAGQSVIFEVRIIGIL